MAYAKPQQWKKEGERLRGKRSEFIDLRFKRWHVVGFGKGRRRQGIPLFSELC